MEQGTSARNRATRHPVSEMIAIGISLTLMPLCAIMRLSDRGILWSAWSWLSSALYAIFGYLAVRIVLTAETATSVHAGVALLFVLALMLAARFIRSRRLPRRVADWTISAAIATVAA